MDTDKHINFEQEIKIMRIRLSQLRRIIKEEVEALVNESQISGTALHDYLEADPSDASSDEFIQQWNRLDTRAKLGYWNDRADLLSSGKLKRRGLTMSSAGDTEMRRLGLSQRDFDDAARSDAAAKTQAVADEKARKAAASLAKARDKFARTGR